MPEGPEVTVIKNGLNNLLKNKYIHDFNFEYKARYQKRRPDNYNEISKEFPIKIKSVESKGKLIYFCFDNDWYLFNTLGMTGGWYSKKGYHTVVNLEYSNKKKDETTKTLYFDDQRHFGTFKFVKGKSELEKKLKTIGKDLLNENVTYTEFLTKYKKVKHKKIDVAMNDQKIFSGIGNYLKAEILYQAKISPHTIIDNIPDWKLKELLDCIKDRIMTSYHLNGASVEHYSDLKGNPGGFHKYFKVYQQKKYPKGNKVISERVSKPNDPKSQKTYWVPSVQKEIFNNESDNEE
jgi:formamidopyrimidine-DNA glycosylase